MPTVLVIEDDHDTRVALRDTLEAEGFTILSAANGKDGFRILEKIQGPVVVLLDQNMPLYNGDDFLALKRREKRLENVPVITVSAVADRSTRLGAVEYVHKPIDFASLVNTIRKHGPLEFWKTKTAVG